MLNKKICMQTRKLNVYRLILTIIFFTTILSITTHAQNVDSLIEIANHSPSLVARQNASKNIPMYLKKIDMAILEVTRLMRVQGINRTNLSNKKLHDNFSKGQINVDNLGNFHVKIYFKQLNDSTISMLKTLGLKVEYVHQDLNNVVCWIPFDVIDSIAKDDNVKGIGIVGIAICQDTYTTLGDQILNCNTARSTYGINGQGVKVGVISDGVDNYSSSLNAGYLPSNFKVLNNRLSIWYPGQTFDEGTAMSEIVHAVAPGASIDFSDYGQNDDDLVNSMNALAIDGCNVIVDDVLYLDEPMFQDGTVAKNVDNLTAKGITYISAAGNYGTSTWDGPGNGVSDARVMSGFLFQTATR